MAKWGENDPRWIVQNREDGQNVNQWHWTESDWTGWAKDKFTDSLKGIKLDEGAFSAETGTVTVSGDVSVNTRKKKTILFYELEVTVQWEGTLKKDGTKAKGTIVMPYISEEKDDDDFEIRLTVEDESNSSKREVKDLFRTAVIPILKERISKILIELKDTTVQKTKLPPKLPSQQKLDSPVVQQPSQPAVVSPVASPPQTSAPQTTSQPTPKKSSSSSVATTSFKLKEKFVCGPQDLFECFVNPGRVRAYAGDGAQISGEKGGKSFLFGGNVETENVEIIPGQKLVQKWRLKEWPKDFYSTATLDFEMKDGKTILNLHHEGVPAQDAEKTEKGWSANYFTRIKGIFGYGTMVF